MEAATLFDALAEKSSVNQRVFDFVGEHGDGSLARLIMQQHLYHEQRRWNITDYLSRIDYDRLSDLEVAFVRNAAKAELTTKPGADRVASLADKECRRWKGRNDAVSVVMQACGTWSRYWNEEESHHETAFEYIAARKGIAPPDNGVIIEFRKVFPDDDMLRTLTLLAVSEINAAVLYSNFANSAHVRDAAFEGLLKQVAADEIQHMNYFISFARALVDSGEYHAKDAFAVAHFFLREDGELQGSRRKNVENRDTHVNWWDAVDVIFDADVNDKEMLRKEKLVCAALHKITGIEVGDADEVEDKWLELLS